MCVFIPIIYCILFISALTTKVIMNFLLLVCFGFLKCSQVYVHAITRMIRTCSMPYRRINMQDWWVMEEEALVVVANKTLLHVC